MEKLVLENEYEIVVPLFGAAFAAPNRDTTMLHQIETQQFYTDLDPYQQC